MAADSTDSLSPDRLRRLLGLTFDAEAQDAQAAAREAAARMLRVRLAGPLPAGAAAVDELQAVLRLRKDLLPEGGRSLGEALLDGKASLGSLRGIKDYGKKLGSQRGSEAQHAVAVAIYYAAIASSLLFHRRRITSYSYEALVEWFGMLADKQWMTPELAAHFAKARDLCRRKTKG